MLDCKNCGMTYNPDEYDICPYCGEEENQREGEAPPDEKKEVPVEPGRDDAAAAATEKSEPRPPKAESAPVSPPPADRKRGFRLALLFVAALAVLAALGYAGAALSGVFETAEPGYTVPDQYPTIQEAIDAAEDGDEIVVGMGVYRENINFNGKSITLRSSDPDDPAVVDQTIIHGVGGGIVVSFRSGETADAVLSGFTIIRGAGVVISGNSNPLIEKNIIEDNTAEYGAGMAIFDSAPTIVGNQIVGNSGNFGGGIFIEKSSPLIEGNIIAENNSTDGGGLVIVSESTPRIIDNRIEDNVATRSGGGFFIDNCEPLIENNSVTGNEAANGAGFFIARAESRDLMISGNEITENRALNAGGGVFIQDASPTFEENIFRDNSSDYYGGGAAVYNSAPLFRRNVFESNRAGEPEGGGAIYALNSELAIAEPDDNTYQQNSPDDIAGE